MTRNTRASRTRWTCAGSTSGERRWIQPPAAGSRRRRRFKPSFGAIADPFGFPHAFIGLQTIAPIARNVGDARLMFEAMAGADVRDPLSVDLPDGTLHPGRALRIAFGPSFGLDVPVDEEVRAG